MRFGSKMPILSLSQSSSSASTSCFISNSSVDFQKKNTNIVILDNVSDYAPLLEYYEELGDSVYRMKKNFGHRAFWYSGEVYDRYRKGYFVITDPDIVPCESCPADFLRILKTARQEPVCEEGGL
jgi:hypothetical protein